MLLLNNLIGASSIASAGAAGRLAKDDHGEALIDFSNPAENLKAYIKLVGNLDPSVETTGWFGGTIYAVIGDQKKVEPLIGVEGCGINRVQQMSGDVYRMFNREFAVYKDLKTGAYLDHWFNPLNQETVHVLPILNRTVTAEVAPIRRQDFDGTIVETPFAPPWLIQQDTAFSVLELHAAFPNPMTPEEWPRESAGRINRTSEMFNRAARYSQLADPDEPQADFTGTWLRIGPWLPWMLMGQSEGHLLYRTFMQKTGRASNLPPQLLDYMTRNYPEFLTAPSPESWGSPNDSSFTVYMENRKPVGKEGR